jgi:hypothetical protein
VETSTQITRMELATAAAGIPEGDLLEFVNALPSERVVAAAVRVKEIRRSLQRMEDALEMRVGIEQLVGEEGWRDPESGEEFIYVGAPTWEVPDPNGLRAALETAGAQPRDLRECFDTVVKISHTGLNRLRDRSDTFADAIRDFRIRKFGPRHLRKREEDR